MSITKIKRRYCDIAPLSAQQKNIWINHEIYPENTAYNMVSCLRLTGCLNVEAFENSLNEIVNRHEILRTSFSVFESEPRQIVRRNMKVPIVEIDGRGLSLEEQPAIFNQAIEKESQSLFDLENGPLLRFVLLRISENENVVLMTAHHIIMDGWSIGLFANELTILYESFCNGNPSSLPEIKVQYSDYALWQNDVNAGQNRKNNSQYWNEIFTNFSFSEFPVDNHRVFKRKGESAAQSITVSSDLYERIKSFSREERTTPFVTLLAVLQVLLYIYTKQQNMLLGYLNAGRNISEVFNLLGHFSNLGIIKASLSDDCAFRKIVKDTRTSFFDAYAHEYPTITDLNEYLNNGEIKPKKTFFPIVMNFMNFPVQQWSLQDIDVQMEPVVTDETRFDMEIVACSVDNELRFIAQYRKDLYSENTVKCILENYQRVLLLAMGNPELSIQEISMMLPDDTRPLESFDKAKHVKNGEAEPKPPVAKMSFTESSLIEIWKDVLDPDDLTLDANYVDIGGDSLAAVRIVSRIKSRLKSVITMREFLANPTIRQLAKFIERGTQNSATEVECLIPSIDRHGDLPLSFFQEMRLRYELNLDVSNVPYLHSSSWFSIRLSGLLDRGALEGAFNYVINRHEVFRTAFWPVMSSVPLTANQWNAVCQLCFINPEQLLPKVKIKQSIVPSVTMNLNFHDISQYADEDKNNEIYIIAEETIQKRYNYESPPLTRAALIRISETEHILIVAAAHLIADGVSMSIYEKELAHAYNALVNKKPVILPTLDIHFTDYAAWQKRQWEAGLLDSVKAYWQQQLDRFAPTDATILPFTDLSGSENDKDFGLEAKYFYCPFSDKLNEAIRKYASSANKTIFSIVMTGFILCLHCESGKNDIGLLAFFANRTRPETENIIGMFATGNIVRVKINADNSFCRCIEAVSESLDGALINQELSVPPLDSRVPKSLCNQLTYRSITFELLADDEGASFSGLEVEKEILGRSKSEYALRSFVIDSRERLAFMFQYNLDLFDIEDIKRMAARTEKILEAIIENPSAVISAVDF
jgi:acyl carrier protein/NRPS condensation-like uncharacterized protein